MIQTRLLKVLLRPHMTDKVYSIAEKVPYVVFKIDKTSTKYEIKHAVEKLFNVKVFSVNILNIKGKYRYFSRIKGKTKSWKKAYVRLYPGHDINFASPE